MSASSFAAATFLGRPVRVLLAASEGGLRALLIHLLERNGYDVISLASNTHTARYLLGARVRPHLIPIPDVVILDADMPDRSVTETLELLRRTHQEAAAIILESTADAHLAATAARLGATLVPKRPVRWTSLSEQIAHLQAHDAPRPVASIPLSDWRLAVGS